LIFVFKEGAVSLSKPDIYKKMITAAAYGDNDIIISLLKKGYDIDAHNNHNRTMITEAVLNGRIETVKLLLTKGVNVNARDQFGWTSVHYAARDGNLKMFEILVKAGADINIKGNIGETALTAAASKNKNFPVIRALIRLGADMNALTEKNDSALLIAARNGATDNVKALIDAGAKVNIVNIDGMTPLSATIWHKEDMNIMNLLINAGAEISPKVSFTPLIASVLNHNIEIMTKLLDLGADPNEIQITETVPDEKNINISESVPLITAIKTGRTAVVKILIKRGADINYRDQAKNGWTPLIQSILSDCKECIPILLKAGADPNIKDNTGMTAAMFAADRGYIRVLKQLYRAGGDLLEKNDKEWTALNILDGAHPEKYNSFMKFLNNEARKNDLKTEDSLADPGCEQSIDWNI
jgi:ankyrin repeat protein